MARFVQFSASVVVDGEGDFGRSKKAISVTNVRCSFIFLFVLRWTVCWRKVVQKEVVDKSGIRIKTRKKNEMKKNMLLI